MYTFVVAHRELLLGVLFVVSAVCFVFGEGFFGRIAGLNPGLGRPGGVPAGVLMGITSAIFFGGGLYVIDLFSGRTFSASVRAILHWPGLTAVNLAVGYGVLVGLLPQLVGGVVRTSVGQRLEAVVGARGNARLQAGYAERRLGYGLTALVAILGMPGGVVTYAVVAHVVVLLNWFGGREAPLWFLVLLSLLTSVLYVIWKGMQSSLEGGYTTRQDKRAYMRKLFEEEFGFATTLYVVFILTYVPWFLSWLVSLASLGYLVYVSGLAFFLVLVAVNLAAVVHRQLVRVIAQAPPHVVFVVFSMGSGLAIFSGRYVVDPALLPAWFH